MSAHLKPNADKIHHSQVGRSNLTGLAAASTMMVISTGPIQVGPYVPAIKYDGDIADTAALESWITQLASQ